MQSCKTHHVTVWFRSRRTVMAAAVCAPTLPPLSTHSLSACAKLPPRRACASCVRKQQDKL